MPTNSAADAAELLAASQVLSRVLQHLNNANFQALLLAIAHRPDGLEKVERFQAVAVLGGRLREAAVEYNRPKAASRADLWAVRAQAGASAVWKRLHTGREPPPLTAVSEVELGVLIDFMHDAELMGLLGLQAGWTPDLKRVDKDLDLL